MEILVNAAGRALIARTGEQQWPPTAKFSILTHDRSEIMGSDMPNPGCGGRNAMIVRARRGKWD